MKWLKTIVSECFALFVDDGRLALAVLAWLVLLWLLLPRVPLPTQWRAAVLLLGLLGILAESVVRRARQR